MALDDGEVVIDRNDTKAALRGGKSRPAGRLIPNEDNSLPIDRGDHWAWVSARTCGTVEDSRRDDRCRLDIEPWSWSDTRASDLWDAPGARPQPMWQRIIAVVLAFALAALLDQVGW